jgi:Protein of unknown function (DUF3987)
MSTATEADALTGEARKSPRATGGSASNSNTENHGNTALKSNTIQLPKTFIFQKPEPDKEAATAATFPLQALPDILRETTASLSECYQVPHCLPAMTALAVLSGAIGKSVVIAGGHRDKITHLNCYVIAASERGSGKGCTAERLARPIVEANDTLRRNHDARLASARSRLGILKKEITRLETQAAGKNGRDRQEAETALDHRHAGIIEAERQVAQGERCSLIVQNTTSEGLAATLAASGETLFSYSAEAGASLRVALGKYLAGGQGDFDLMLSAYSVEFCRVDRAGRAPITLKEPCLSLLWLAQGCVIRELCANPEAIERGLTARALIFETGAERQLDDRKTTRAETDAWDTLLREVLSRRLAGEVREIKADAEASEVFAQFHDESVRLGRAEFADVDGELSRWRENAIKVAGLLAVAEEAETLTAGIASRGCEIVRWCALSYLGILGASRAEAKRKDMARLLEIVAQHGGSVRLGELDRQHGMTRQRVVGILSACPNRLELFKVESSKAGRPAEILRPLADKSDKSDLLNQTGNKSDKSDLSPAPRHK